MQGVIKKYQVTQSISYYVTTERAAMALGARALSPARLQSELGAPSISSTNANCSYGGEELGFREQC